MKKPLLTDVELRSQWSQNRTKTYYVEEGVMLTPAAKDFVREHEISLCYVSGCDAADASCKETPLSAPAPLYGGNPSVWNRAKAPEKPEPVLPSAPLYAGNPTVWSRDGVSALPSHTDYAGNPPVWKRPAPKETPVMTTTPIPKAEGRPRYRLDGSQQELNHKPEAMTHLRGNVLVPKTDPRIAFRGKLDSLMAYILELQLLAEEKGETKVLQDLDDLLDFTRKLLAAEVKGEALPPLRLLGMTSEDVRDVSHHVKREFGINHPIPSYKMGAVCVGLNRLRTQVREVELAAALAFDSEGTCTRTDLVEGLNRLSSAVYIIFCRTLSGKARE